MAVEWGEGKKKGKKGCFRLARGGGGGIFSNNFK